MKEWVDSIATEEFRREHFQRAPLAQPQAAASAIELLQWETIERLLEAGADLLLVRNSALVREPGRVSAEAARTLFASGYSIVLRRCERHDDSLRALADAFAEQFEGDVSIQVYATPRGFHSFSWHYDCEDVFIAQTAGEKEYFLRENTINPRPRISAMPRDMQFERETTPTVAATLIAGDWLYIPRGWWHVAKARDAAFSISVGVLAPDAR
ncbi:MAG TPA: cupin domain-containing protein [Thermoanaerobaculia bacterium]|jgi:ribosomal protein L16 Arg81 hydroxylase